MWKITAKYRAGTIKRVRDNFEQPLWHVIPLLSVVLLATASQKESFHPFNLVVLYCQTVQNYIFFVCKLNPSIENDKWNPIGFTLSGQCQQEKVDVEGGASLLCLPQQVWFFEIFPPNTTLVWTSCDVCPEFQSQNMPLTFVLHQLHAMVSSDLPLV